MSLVAWESAGCEGPARRVDCGTGHQFGDACEESSRRQDSGKIYRSPENHDGQKQDCNQQPEDYCDNRQQDQPS